MTNVNNILQRPEQISSNVCELNHPKRFDFDFGAVYKRDNHVDLQNEPSAAKIVLDTAENGPLNVWVANQLSTGTPPRNGNTFW